MKRVRLHAKKERKVPVQFKPEFGQEVERLCKLGARDIDLARFFNVALRTIHNWKGDHPEFFEKMQRGKLDADVKVAGALYKNANGFYYYEEQLVKKWRKKYKNGEVVEAFEVVELVPVKKYSPPNVTAEIFWLKNRDPAEWRDAQPEKSEGEGTAKKYTMEELEAEFRKRGIVMIEDAYSVQK